MSATARGGLILVALLAFAGLCAAMSFVLLPSMGVAVGIPVLSVPAEAYNGALPSDDVHMTNTVMAVLLTDVIVLAFAFFAWRVSKGWKNEIPGRFQALVELIGDFIYGQSRSFAGLRPLARNWVFPFAASIFIFLLVANWMKLLPGVESVGVWHCAHEGFAGYPGAQTGVGYQLYVDAPVDAGTTATAADYENCHHWMDYGAVMPSQEDRSNAADALLSVEAALLEDASLTDEARDAALHEARLAATESLWDHPSYGLSSEQLRKGVIPYVQVVTPFVRGAATDLNVTVGLAILTVIVVQIFGVAALGPSYFQKFVNLGALGNVTKKPLGAIDFIVGLIEIISEIGKIISLAFRLFGNLFAGGIVLVVMSFLLAAFVPVIFYGLEVIITTVQAYVFAVLTLVFAGQAMTGHHGDDDHAEEAH